MFEHWISRAEYEDLMADKARLDAFEQGLSIWEVFDHGKRKFICKKGFEDQVESETFRGAIDKAMGNEN